MSLATNEWYEIIEKSHGEGGFGRVAKCRKVYNPDTLDRFNAQV
jgi:hypothetical protein